MMNLDGYKIPEMTDKLLSFWFEESKEKLRKKKTIISEFDFDYRMSFLKQTGANLIKRDLMTFNEFQKVRKNLRTYQKRYCS